MSAPTTPQGGAQAAPAVFFKLSGTYVVAPETSVEQLVSDCYSLLSSADGVAQLIEPDTDALWALLHLLRQARCLITAADVLLQRTDAKGGAA